MEAGDAGATALREKAAVGDNERARDALKSTMRDWDRQTRMSIQRLLAGRGHHRSAIDRSFGRGSQQAAQLFLDAPTSSTWISDRVCRLPGVDCVD